ncbi:MAG: hypothetical protein OXI40_12025 [Chloroflexota bacterium]|nr:hypothetical protein [Chloroflexota bacterium]
MASQVWRDLKASARGLPNRAINESERRIDAPGGGMIAVRSTHYPDNLRGEGLDLAVLDEAAYMEPRVWPEIVRPMLTTTRGNALLLSTPFGRNWFYDLFQKGRNARYQPEWQSFWFPTDRNPNIAAEELESIRRMTAEHIWGTEYRARFDDDSGQVFRGIRAAIARDPYPQTNAGRLYVAGVDWGRDRDYTVIVIIDAGERRMVALDRFNQIGWSLQRGRLQAICDRWQPQQIWAEANSFGSPNIEALLAEGLPMRSFTTTSKSKSPLIESLALAIERRFIGLLDHPVLLAELASYTMQRLPGGGYRYGAPTGLHDDTVMATALAWQGVEKSGPRFGFA